jgi:hypothetical protein
VSAFVILRKYDLFLTNNPLAKSADYFQSDFGKGGFSCWLVFIGSLPALQRQSLLT